MKSLLEQPIITEKATRFAKEQDTYVFSVLSSATKPEIRKAIEKKYNVHVRVVRTLNQHAKTRHYRMIRGEHSRSKKAIVVLKKGEKLPVLPQ